MIRFTFILSALFLALNVSYAQSPHNLKGPTVKNYKPWQEQARKSVLIINVDESTQIGPDFKNRKPWLVDQLKSVVDSDLKARERVVGPKAKNQKPWNRD